MRILSTNDDENGETDSKVNPKYIKQFWGSNSVLPFLPKKIVISKQEKLLCNLNNKEIYVIHIKTLIKFDDYKNYLKLSP